ncbi:MAG: hypothetical protein WC455_26620 [Dehalococcoidia bacterium]|jgi:hypothetical protein
MPDITMCTNEDCKVKLSCYRYMAVPAPAQSYARFEWIAGVCFRCIWLTPYDKAKKIVSGFSQQEGVDGSI